MENSTRDSRAISGGVGCKRVCVGRARAGERRLRGGVIRRIDDVVLIRPLEDASTEKRDDNDDNRKN